MDSVIKANVFTRQSSLLQGENKERLLHVEKIICNGLYLSQGQKFINQTKLHYVIMQVLQGTGELKYEIVDKVVDVQLVKGDIIYLAPHADYSILNVTTEMLILTQTII